MRAIKYVFIAAGVVALLATIAWVLRDRLIQDISNPLLREYGITVTDVSLDALAAKDASISYLELVHQTGTTIRIEDLTLPYSASAKRLKTYSARRVSIITATRSDSARPELAELITQFLTLSDNLENSALIVGELTVPPYPTIHDLRWDIRKEEQRAGGTIEALNLSATISRVDTDTHAAAFSILPESKAAVGHTIRAELRHGEHSVVMTGESPIDLSLWQPVARLTGIIPGGVELLSGTAILKLDVDVPVDPTQTATLTVGLTPTSAVNLRYTNSSGDATEISVQSAGTVAVAATFPDAYWTLQQPQAALLVTYGEWTGIPVSLERLSCRLGPVCTMDSRVVLGKAELPVGTINEMEIVASQSVSFGETGASIELQPGATFRVSGLVDADFNVDRIQGSLVSAASLDLVETGWALSADSVDAQVDSLSVSTAATISLPVFLEGVRVSRLDEKLAAASTLFAPSSRVTLAERRITLPGFKGKIAAEDGNVAADLTTVGLHRNGTVTARHDADTRRGRLTVSNSAVSFAAKNLSGRVAPWPRGRDLVSGTISVEVDAAWSPKGPGLEFDARASVAADNLAGYYGDTAFTGLSTRLETRYRPGTGFKTNPARITVGLIESGLPIENLSADFTVDLNAPALDVQNLRMTTFDGVVTADPFSFRTDTAVNTLTMKADSIDLARLLSLETFETIEVSGRVAATLPLTIEDKAVTIVGGNLIGLPPGGVIRYRPRTAPDKSDTSGLGFATRVLSNFEYKSLTSEVNLNRDGDLKLQLQLTGRNPDLDEKRPVVLNLGVENNLPQMLRSLRATRAVEEVLEKRLAR